MKEIGIGLGTTATGELDALIQAFQAIETEGFQTAWIPNIFELDAMTVAALAGRETRTLEIGVAVVPTHSRHPLYMAQQALSTQAAARGRFVLGIGPSHAVVIENMLGLSYAKPARHVREYVTILNQLFTDGKADFQGETYRVGAGLQVKIEKPPPVLIGALGPRMVEIAGSLTDGTITWMTGPRTLGERIVPGLRKAAEAAGRPPPRTVAGLPVAVTSDPAAARESASKIFGLYGGLPSYRAMLDNEGVNDPGDLTIAGDERAVEDAIRSLVSAGVTDFNAAIFPVGDDPAPGMKRTRELLAGLARN